MVSGALTDFSSAPLLASFTDADGHTTRYTYGISSASKPTAPPRPNVPIPGADSTGVTPPYLTGLGKLEFPNGTFMLCYAAGDRPLGKRVGGQVFGSRLGVNHVYDPVARTMKRYVGTDDDVTTYSFDESFQVTGIVDAVGNAYSYEYDSSMRLVTGIDPRFGVRRFAYDDEWSGVSQTDPLGGAAGARVPPGLPGAHAHHRAGSERTGGHRPRLRRGDRRAAAPDRPGRADDAVRA